MQSIIQSNIFFFMSSIALVIVTVLLIVILLYIISVMRIIRDVALMVQKKGQDLSVKINEIEKYVEDSTVMRWVLAIAGKNKKAKRRTGTV